MKFNCDCDICRETFKKQKGIIYTACNILLFLFLLIWGLTEIKAYRSVQEIPDFKIIRIQGADHARMENGIFINTFVRFENCGASLIRNNEFHFIGLMLENVSALTILNGTNFLVKGNLFTEDLWPDIPDNRISGNIVKYYPATPF